MMDLIGGIVIGVLVMLLASLVLGRRLAAVRAAMNRLEAQDDDYWGNF